MIHHLAIRLDRIDENSLKILSQLLVDEKFQKYIISKEIANITKKVHYHVYACCETNKTYKNYTNQFRRLLVNKTNCINYQYCIQKCKDVDKYLVYMLKDGCIIKSDGFEEEELKEVLKTTQQINKEKTKKMKQQLVDEVFSATGNYDDYRQIMKRIIVYHVERDYLPPTPTLLLQYTIYVMVRLNLDTTELYMAKLNI